uniref:Uncharacterized protein n=1 Tax=Moniliophthora roreri TaxID=221103 RepID=A0A0W0FCG4_MONRR
MSSGYIYNYLSCR